MPMEYKFDPNWTGESEDPNVPGRMNPNHSSGRGSEEVLRLAKAGLSKVRQASKDDLSDKKLEFIRTALIDDMGEILVEKGIHQRTTEPHIRARITSKGNSATAHIHLSEVRLPKDTSDTGMFAYEAIAVSARKDGPLYPNTTVQKVRNRRDSVDLSVLDTKRREMQEASMAALRAEPQPRAWGAGPPKV